MTETYFVDTNVLVYARDLSEDAKQPLAQRWLEHLWRSRTGRVSVQVLQEYYQVVTRRLKPGLPAADARQDVRDLQLWHPQTIDAAVIERAWDLEDRFQLSWWDALIVGACQTAGCPYLLSEDLQSGQLLGTVEVVDPFRTAPPRG